MCCFATDLNCLCNKYWYIFENFCFFSMQITYWDNRLDIYDGTHEQHMKIGEVYGNSNNKLLKSISSSGKSIFIDFKKQLDGNTWYENVKFTALIKYKKINFDCQTWLDVKKNILMSPNHPNNINCSWVITASFGSYIILNFEFIEVVNFYY